VIFVVIGQNTTRHELIARRTATINTRHNIVRCRLDEPAQGGLYWLVLFLPDICLKQLN